MPPQNTYEKLKTKTRRERESGINTQLLLAADAVRASRELTTKPTLSEQLMPSSRRQTLNERKAVSGIAAPTPTRMARQSKELKASDPRLATRANGTVGDTEEDIQEEVAEVYSGARRRSPARHRRSTSSQPSVKKPSSLHTRSPQGRNRSQGIPLRAELQLQQEGLKRLRDNFHSLKGVLESERKLVVEQLTVAWKGLAELGKTMKAPNDATSVTKEAEMTKEMLQKDEELRQRAAQVQEVQAQLREATREASAMKSECSALQNRLQEAQERCRQVEQEKEKLMEHKRAAAQSKEEFQNMYNRLTSMAVLFQGHIAGLRSVPQHEVLQFLSRMQDALGLRGDSR